MAEIETARLVLRPGQAGDLAEFTRLAGTVVAWYAIDRSDWRDADQSPRATPAG
jgi:hypothetical protein